MELSALKRILM